MSGAMSSATPDMSGDYLAFQAQFTTSLSILPGVISGSTPDTFDWVTKSKYRSASSMGVLSGAPYLIHKGHTCASLVLSREILYLVAHIWGTPNKFGAIVVFLL